MEKSKCTGISFAREDVLVLTFVRGRIEGGVQKPYTVREGDRMELESYHGGTVHWIIRGGIRYGILVNGVDGQKLWEVETRVEQELHPEKFSSIRVAAMGRSDNLVSRVLWKCKPIDASDVFFDYVVEYTVTLFLKETLTLGTEYMLSLEGVGAEQEELLFHYQPETVKSPAVHASQVGYRCDDGGKVGYLSHWAGEKTGVTYDQVEFEVIDEETNLPVFSGKGKKFGETSDFEMENGDAITVFAPVWQLDFTGLTAPGTYHLYVKGVGVSYSFTIGRDAWQDAFRVSMQGFLHQRSGIALDGTLTDYRRPRPYHPDDGLLVYQSNTTLMETRGGLSAFGMEANTFVSLVRGCTDQLVPNVWGGYFDAADYDRRIQHITCSNNLIELYSMFPEYFDGLKLAIPESGNGLPDVLNEALFNLDFYRRLQLPNGAIRGGAEASEHPMRGECSWQESLKIMVYAPDHWSAYRYAGSAAFMAKALGSHPLASVYRESAIRAAKWGVEEEAKGSDKPYRSGVERQIRREKNIMAAHLYDLTGEKQYLDLFNETLDVFSDDAAFTYLRTGWPKEASLAEKCMDLLKAHADYGLTFQEKNPYHMTLCDARRGTRGYGHFYAAPDLKALLRVYYLTGERKYLDAAVRGLNVSCGANPTDMTYTVGIGTKPPYGVQHHDSRRTAQKTPNGITIFGNFNLERGGLYDLNKKIIEDREVMNPAPVEYPSMETYVGAYHFAPMTEYTVDSTIATTAYMWGFLAARK